MVDSPLGAWLRGNPRKVGLVLLLAGWGIAYWGYLGAIRAAHAHQPMTVVPGTFGVLVSGGVLGLICFVGGRSGMETLQRRGLGYIRYFAFIAVCLIMPGFLAYLWLRHLLNNLGYD